MEADPTSCLVAHVTALRKLDDRSLAGTALLCSCVRLLAIRQNFRNASPRKFAKFVKLFYSPLAVEKPLAEAAFASFDRPARKIAEPRRDFIAGPGPLSTFYPLPTAIQTWRYTWLGCIQSEFHGPAREMWGHVRRGFPYVEEQAEIIVSFLPHDSVRCEFEVFQSAVRDLGGGPDYARIPSGFDLIPAPASQARPSMKT